VHNRNLHPTLRPNKAIQWLLSHRSDDLKLTNILVTYLSIGTINLAFELPSQIVSQVKIISNKKTILPIRYHDKNFNKISDLSNFNKTLMVYENTTNDEDYAKCIGNGTLDTPFCSQCTSQLDYICAYAKRLSPAMPKILNADDYKPIKDFVNEWLIKNLEPLPTIEDTEKLHIDCINNSKHYSVNRRLQLIKAYKSLFYVPIGEHDYLCKGFLKREFYEELKLARYICSRSDRFKVLVAPYIKLIEDRLYQLPYFIKGMNLMKMNEKYRTLLNHKYYIQTDYSSFESSFVPLYTDVMECQLFRYMLQNNKEILGVIMGAYFQPTPNGFKPRINEIRGKRYKAFVQGSRMSGEMWTSLGNGFSNLLNMLYLMKIKNVNGTGFVEGDDAVWALDNNTITNQDFENLGFNIKMGVSTDITDTSFCSCYYNPKTDNILISPETILRMSWTCDKKYFNHRTQALLKWKAQSAYITGKHTPILSKYALKMMQLNNTKEELYNHNNWYEYQWTQLIENENFKPVAILDEDRIFYEQKFNITINQQLAIEKQIELGNLDSPLLLKIFPEVENQLNLHY